VNHAQIENLCYELLVRSAGSQPVAHRNRSRCLVQVANLHLRKRRNSARGCPCPGAGVCRKAQPGWRSAVGIRV